MNAKLSDLTVQQQPIRRLMIYGKTADIDPASMLLHNECTVAANSAAFQIEHSCPGVEVINVTESLRLKDVKRLAVSNNCDAMFYLSVMRRKSALPHRNYYKSVNIHFPVGDVSMWSIFLANELQKAGLFVYQHVSDSQVDRDMVYHGCVHIGITMGVYHSSEDLRKIYVDNVPIVTKALARCVKYMTQPVASIPPEQRLELFTLGDDINGYNTFDHHQRQAQCAEPDIRRSSRTLSQQVQTNRFKYR